MRFHIYLVSWLPFHQQFVLGAVDNATLCALGDIEQHCGHLEALYTSWSFPIWSSKCSGRPTSNEQEPCTDPPSTKLNKVSLVSLARKACFWTCTSRSSMVSVFLKVNEELPNWTPLFCMQVMLLLRSLFNGFPIHLFYQLASEIAATVKKYGLSTCNILWMNGQLTGADSEMMCRINIADRCWLLDGIQYVRSLCLKWWYSLVFLRAI